MPIIENDPVTLPAAVQHASEVHDFGDKFIFCGTNTYIPPQQLEPLEHVPQQAEGYVPDAIPPEGLPSMVLDNFDDMALAHLPDWLVFGTDSTPIVITGNSNVQLPDQLSGEEIAAVAWTDSPIGRGTNFLVEEIPDLDFHHVGEAVSDVSEMLVEHIPESIKELVAGLIESIHEHIPEVISGSFDHLAEFFEHDALLTTASPVSLETIAHFDPQQAELPEHFPEKAQAEGYLPEDIPGGLSSESLCNMSDTVMTQLNEHVDWLLP